MLLTLICLLGLIPATAFAASADTIKLERFGMSGVSYQSASLGRCTLHQMYYGVGGKTSVGFCGVKGGGMGTSLIGQTWGNPQPISDPTVKTMMAYYYAHSTGTFTDQAHALGVDDIWGPEYTWYMNAWVQAIVWRYKAGSLSNPTVACAEELMYVWNSLKSTNYNDIDQINDGTSFRDRTQYILDLGNQGVWGDCSVNEYSFTGSGSSAHPANTVQSVMIGELSVTHEQYTIVIKKVDATNPTKGLAGAQFHVEATNGSFSRDVTTGADGSCTISPPKRRKAMRSIMPVLSMLSCRIAAATLSQSPLPIRPLSRHRAISGKSMRTIPAEVLQAQSSKLPVSIITSPAPTRPEQVVP